MIPPPRRPRRRLTKTGNQEAERAENSTHLIGGSVETYLESQGIASIATVARIIDCWPKIVGQQVAEHAQPSKIVEGELVILVDHPAWATELRLLAPKIISQLENELKTSVVNRIKVHVRG